MTSSPNTETLMPSYTAEEIAAELKLGDKFAEWLSKEKFAEDDPLLILDYVRVKEEDREKIKNALFANGAKEGFSDFVLRFDTWKELFEAQRDMRKTMPWLFYNTDGVRAYRLSEDDQWTPHPTEPTILTTTLSYYDPETDKLMAQSYPFFEV
ncbi:hypothetical protein ACQ4LE_003145 [Meloidogyne hapla]